MAKSLKKNMFLNTVLTVSNFVFPLITYSYVARILTPSGTGKIAFVDSILAYFLYIGALGIHPYGRREVAKFRDDKMKLSQLVKELLTINLFATVVSYILLSITVLGVPKFREYTILFVIMSTQIILKMFGVEWLYEGLEEFSYITKRSIVFKFISVVLTFVLINDINDVPRYAFIHVFAVSASSVLNFFYSRKYIDYKTRTNKLNLKVHMKPIFILFFASIAITIYANFDVFMIGMMDSEYEVGLYNAALKIKNIVLALSTAITAVLVPRIAYYFEKNDYKEIHSILVKSVTVSLMTAVPLAVYIIINRKNVLWLIGGVEYISASNTLIVSMLCIFALVMTNLYGVQILIPAGKEKRYTQSIVVGLFINLVLNFLFIPKFGSFGAAFATLITEVWNVIWMGMGCLEFIKAMISNVQIIKYCLAIICAIIVNVLFYAAVNINGLISSLAITTILFFGAYYSVLLLLKEKMIIVFWTDIKFKIWKFISEKVK